MDDAFGLVGEALFFFYSVGLMICGKKFVSGGWPFLLIYGAKLMRCFCSEPENPNFLVKTGVKKTFHSLPIKWTY